MESYFVYCAYWITVNYKSWTDATVRDMKYEWKYERGRGRGELRRGRGRGLAGTGRKMAPRNAALTNVLSTRPPVYTQVIADQTLLFLQSIFLSSLFLSSLPPDLSNPQILFFLLYIVRILITIHSLTPHQ